jgi:hypothetical protein
LGGGEGIALTGDALGGITLVTFPERRHLVQTHIRLIPALVFALTCCKFGFHFFFEALWEWLTLCPKKGPFPQISHTFGIFVLLKTLFIPLSSTKIQRYF